MDIAPDAPTDSAPVASASAPPPVSPNLSSSANPRSVGPSTRWTEIVTLVGVCVLGDVVWLGGTGGTGLAVLLVSTPLLVLLGRGRPVWSARLAGVGALIVVLAARAVWQPSVWTAIAAVGSLFAFALTATRRDGYLPELAVSSVGSMLQAFVTMRDWVRDGWRRVTRGRTLRLPWVTVVVPVAVVALFAIVLVAANPVLERWATSAGDAISEGAFLPSPLRVLVWAVCAWLAAAWLRPFHAELFVPRTGDLHRLDESSTAAAGPYRVAPASEEARGDVAFTTSRNVLVGVNVLFAVCVALDAVHLWAGRVPDGMIHTDYAHRGAAWLTVALLLCTVVLSAIFRGAQNFGSGSRTLRILAFAWIAQSLVLAAGTLRRIQLYVDDSGLTNLRIVGFVGSALVAVGLVHVAVKVARRRTILWLVRKQLDALGIAVVLFLVTPTDALVTAFNVARIARGDDRPLLHLTEQTLSAEGALGLAPLLDHRDPVVRRGTAALLADLGAQLDREERSADRWTELEIARPLARREIARVRPRIDALLGPSPDLRWSVHPARIDLRQRGCAANDLPCGRDLP